MHCLFFCRNAKNVELSGVVLVSFPDVGGGNAKDSDPHALANIPLKWMLKEIIAADTGLIFRRSALERAHIDLGEIVEAAARTKLEDAERAARIAAATPSNPSSPVDGSGTSMDAKIPLTNLDIDLNISPIDGAAPVDVAPQSTAAALEAKVKSQATTDSLYKRWKTSSALADSECKITDELSKNWSWWLLEFIPFIDSLQDPHGHWKNRL